MLENIALKSLNTFNISENKKLIRKKHQPEYMSTPSLMKDVYVGKSNVETVGASEGPTGILAHYTKESKLQKFVENWLCSSNKSTDGSDDGKLGFFSKVGNVLEGIGKAAVGTIYNVLADPVRLAKTTATGLILGALASNPVTAMAVAALGVVTAIHLVVVGVGTISDSIKEAEKAQSDSAAKDAYEKMGQGILEIGAGVVSGVGAGKLVKEHAPQLPSSLSNFKNGVKDFIKNPKEFISSGSLPDITIPPEDVEKVMVETILDICNIEDDI